MGGLSMWAVQANVARRSIAVCNTSGIAAGNDCGNALRACPACKEQHSDWEARLRAGDSSSSLGVAPLPQTGASYS